MANVNGISMSFPVAAEDYHRVDRRQSHQEKRIDEGILRGQLTDPEVARLNAQKQKSIT